MLRRINKILPELILSILIYGIALQLLGMWFVKDPVNYTIGIWIGVGMAVGMAIHMAVVIQDAMELCQASENYIRRKVIFHNMIRYGLVCIIFFCVMKFQIGSLVTVFLGVFGLKIGAYLCPFTNKVIEKMTRNSKKKS